MLSVFKKTIQCFFCNESVQKKEAFTVNIDTSEGPLVLKTCKACAKEFDQVLEQIEEVKNEGL